ncbi:MAG: hypothetical protein ACP5JG_05690 [Anaerolineae bacterium]
MTRLKRSFPDFDLVKERNRHRRRLYRSEVLEMRMRQLCRKQHKDSARAAK